MEEEKVEEVGVEEMKRQTGEALLLSRKTRYRGIKRLPSIRSYY